MTPRTPRQSARQGATALEFGLSFPLYMLLISGMFDFGLMFFQYSAMDVAVHAGCRDGSVQDSADFPQTLTMPEDGTNIAFDTLTEYTATRVSYRLQKAGINCPDTPRTNTGDVNDPFNYPPTTTINSATCDILVDEPAMYRNPARSVHCTIDYTYSPIFGFSMTAPIPLHAETAIRQEFQR